VRSSWKRKPLLHVYLGVVFAALGKEVGRSGKALRRRGAAERNQAQLYLNLAEVYATRAPDEAVEALQAGTEIARRDIRLNIAMNNSRSVVHRCFHS